MTDLEQAIEGDQSQTLRVVQTFKRLNQDQLTRCICGSTATVLFTETMGSISLERRLFCDHCNPFFIMEPIPEFPWNPA